MASSSEVLAPPMVEQVYQANAQESASSNINALFDPSRHLEYSPPDRILKMQDLAQTPTERSSVAHTDRFALPSYEGIPAHRREIFKQDTLDNLAQHTRPGSVQTRGLAPRYAPFLHWFGHSREVLEIVSENAGIDLVPAMDHEICHVKAQMGADGVERIWKTPVEPSLAAGEGIAGERHQSQPDLKY